MATGYTSDDKMPAELLSEFIERRKQDALPTAVEMMPPNMIRIGVGRRISAVRRELGKSQQEVADFLHVSRAQVSQIEIGNVDIDVSRLVRFALWTSTKLADYIQYSVPGDLRRLAEEWSQEDGPPPATFEKVMEQIVVPPDSPSKENPFDRDGRLAEWDAVFLALDDERRDAILAAARALKKK